MGRQPRTSVAPGESGPCLHCLPHLVGLPVKLEADWAFLLSCLSVDVWWHPWEKNYYSSKGGKATLRNRSFKKQITNQVSSARTLFLLSRCLLIQAYISTKTGREMPAILRFGVIFPILCCITCHISYNECKQYQRSSKKRLEIKFYQGFLFHFNLLVRNTVWV